MFVDQTNIDDQLFETMKIRLYRRLCSNWSKTNICRHTASIAAGNHGIPVVVAGHHFGNASGMAPRSQ